MSAALDAAKAFFEDAKTLSGDDLSAAVKALPDDVRKAYSRLRKEAYFAPENEVVDSRKESLSPSGKYKLVVSRFTTGPGSWNYAQGVVNRKDDGKPIAVIQRNYGAFPNTWVEGHPNGHDYLVCGEDYQGQTVVELDTGERRDLLSDGTEKGWGFCWSSHSFNAPNQILTVCGCHWACPYEHRFYDFSDPMSGWPEIEPEDGAVDADENKEPEIAPDGTITCFMTRYTDDDDGDDETPDDEKPKKEGPIVDVRKTYRREGLKLLLTEEWVSDYEKDRRKRREEWAKKDKEWTANFKATDPLYLMYAELVKDPALSPEDHMGVGITYDTWCPDFKGREKRWCRRIITHKGQKTGPTVDLEWACDTGPIKLVLYRDGKSDGDKFFEHSVEAMREAFTFAKEYARAH